MSDLQQKTSMDYEAHRATYARFTSLVKVSTISAVIFLVCYYIFVVA